MSGPAARAGDRVVTLVAATPSGEAFMARDGFGTLWWFSSSREPVAVVGADEEDAIQRAVLAGFDRVDEEFRSWQALSVELERRAAALDPDTTVDVDIWDQDRIERALAMVDEWIDNGKAAGARRVLRALLSASVVRQDPDLLAAVADRLDAGFRLRPVQLPLDPPDPRHAEARRRMVLAAA